MCSPTHSHNIQVFPMCSPTHSHYNIHSQPHSMTVRDRMRVVVVVLVVVVVDAERLPWSQRGRGRRSKHHRPIRIQYFWWRPIGTDHGFWTNQKPASSNLDEWEARIMFSAAPTGDRTVALQQNNTESQKIIKSIQFLQRTLGEHFQKNEHISRNNFRDGEFSVFYDPEAISTHNHEVKNLSRSRRSNKHSH